MTFLLLMIMSLITFMIIFYSAPQSYINEIDKQVDKASTQLIEKLEYAKEEEYGNILEAFSKEYDVIAVMYDSKGQDVGQQSLFLSIEKSGDDETERTDILKSYSFTQKDNQESYTVKVFGTLQRVNLFSMTLKANFKYLFLIVFILSVIIAYFYSYFLTKPILIISKQSERLAACDFNVNFTNKRDDELGTLSKNLDYLTLELSRTLENLEAANAHLLDDIEKEKQLEKAQRTFFMTTSHELKTPLTILKGQLQGMIYKVGQYTNRDKYLYKSYEVTQRMEQLIQEMLTISRITSEHFHLNYQDISINTLIQDCLIENDELAVQKDISFHSQLEKDMCIKGDEVLMKMVINNIISNALYYSPSHEHIYLKVFIEQKIIHLTIENTGVFLTEKDSKQLFKPFVREDKSRNSRTGGSGLGLYIVKTILDLHNYEYTLSNTKRGVEFNILFKDS